MPSPSAPDTSELTWQDHLDQLATYLEEHGGHFPAPQSDDPDQARLVAWWLQQTTPQVRDTMSPTDRQRLDRLRSRADQLRAAPDWSARLEAVSAYVDTHDGRFPPTWGVSPDVADLARWWVAQNIQINQARMTAAQRGGLACLRSRAQLLRAQARDRRRAQVRRDATDRARAVSRAAAHAGAKAAAEALASPHLIPGDREVLQLRAQHPDASLAELAELAGMSVSQLSAKLYGALRRGPNSSASLTKAFPDRILAPHQAAEVLGVEPAVLSRWTAARLVACQRNISGHRRYRGSELLRVQQLLAQGWPEQFTRAANTGVGHAA